MLSAYAAHLKRLKEEYGMASDTASSGGPQTDEVSRDTQDDARATALSSSRFNIRTTDADRKASPTFARQLPSRTFNEERSQLLQLLEQHRDRGDASDDATKSRSNPNHVIDQQHAIVVSASSSSTPYAATVMSTTSLPAAATSVHSAPVDERATHGRVSSNRPASSSLHPPPEVEAWGGGIATDSVQVQNQKRYREILNEVETLSATITAMHRQRNELESQWSQKLREVRQESDARESQRLNLEARCEELAGITSDLNAQLAAAKKELLRWQRECEMYRQQALLQADQEQEVAQLTRDAEEREKLIHAQERCMRELEVRSEAASAAAHEYEQRFLRLQQSLQLETTSASQRETHWHEMLSTLGGSLLLFAREMEETCLLLRGSATTHATVADGSRTGSTTPRRSTSYAQSNEVESSSSASIAGGAAEKNLERVMDVLESAMGANPSSGDFRRAKDQFSDAVQRQLRRFSRAVGAAVHEMEEQRDKLSRIVADGARAEELVGRAEASAAASSRDNVQLRRDKQELLSTIDMLRASEADLKRKLVELVTDAEKREESNVKHIESLRQLLEGADLDLHRHRMRVNELEATNTRLVAQRALAEEELKGTIQQLRQSLVLKDGHIGRLRSELERVRQRMLLGDESGAKFAIAADGSASDVADAHRSISVGNETAISAAAPTTASGATANGAAFLRSQNQQLAAHIDSLQKRLDRMKEEQDSALQTIEKQKEVIRQHEDVLDVVASKGIHGR